MITLKSRRNSERGPEHSPVFLSADWRNLVMVTYEVDAEVLVPWLPAGVELDAWQGQNLVSLVGFEFRGTRVLGMSVPGHRDFPEVNLRFYVRRKVGDNWRRGVVFVKELVPRRAIAWMARRLYGERYETTRMNGASWRVSGVGEGPGLTTHVRYWWRGGGRWEGVFAEAKGEPQFAAEDSRASFITDHARVLGVSRKDARIRGGAPALAGPADLSCEGGLRLGTSLWQDVRAGSRGALFGLRCRGVAGRRALGPADYVRFWVESAA